MQRPLTAMMKRQEEKDSQLARKLENFLQFKTKGLYSCLFGIRTWEDTEIEPKT